MHGDETSQRPGDTSVFIAAIADDYATMARGQARPAFTRHSLTGMHRSIVANRVSYTMYCLRA